MRWEPRLMRPEIVHFLRSFFWCLCSRMFLAPRRIRNATPTDPTKFHRLNRKNSSFFLPKNRFLASFFLYSVSIDSIVSSLLFLKNKLIRWYWNLSGTRIEVESVLTEFCTEFFCLFVFFYLIMATGWRKKNGRGAGKPRKIVEGSRPPHTHTHTHTHTHINEMNK